MCERAGRAKGAGSGALEQRARRMGAGWCWAPARVSAQQGQPLSQVSPAVQRGLACVRWEFRGGGPGTRVVCDLEGLEGFRRAMVGAAGTAIRRCRKGVGVTSGESMWMTGEGTGHLACWFHQSPCPVSLGRGCHCPSRDGEIDQGSPRPTVGGAGIQPSLPGS